MAGDSYWNSVKLLLHGNGADGSTTITDSSDAAHTVTPYGDAQLDTADKKYGTASILFDGTGDGLEVADSADWQFGTGDFTIEGWVKFDDTSGNDVLLTYAPSGGGAAAWLIRRSGTQWRMQIYTGSTFKGNVDFGSLTTGVWYHFALVRSGNNLLRFVDGVGEAAVDVTGVGPTVPTSPILYLASILSSRTDCLAGRLDDIRITKGVARYTADFTPPAAEFEEGLPPPVDDLTAIISAPSPLGPAFINATIPCQLLAILPSPLGWPSIVVQGYNDFGSVLPSGGFDQYRLVIDTPGGQVTVPMKSWQATLQTDESSYLQAVIPAAGSYADAIAAATVMTVWRRQCTADGATVVEAPMASGPVQTVRFDQGPTQHTATISGYWQQFVADPDPPEIYDRALVGVRARSSTNNGQNCRCAIDWLLQPGRRAFIDGDPIIVRWMNYYVSNFDAYMDVGE
jgi:hypothetical protein